MYQVNLKVQRKEGVKATPEVYLVDAVSFTDIDVRLNEEFKDIHFDTHAARQMNFAAINENSNSGIFFKIEIMVENLESKAIKESFIQEAETDAEARELFRNQVKYGEIVGINLTNYKGIIKAKDN